MINDSLSARKEFEKNGFVVYKKIFTESFVYNLINEIYKSSNSINYYDNNNKLRRIEKLYDKGQYLIDANKKILELIKSISSNNFLIFKDKFNAKPPGGEGFFAHYDGVFKFKDEKDVLRNGWYEYGNYFLNALIALDKCNGENGSIELAKAHKGNFNELLKNTKNDGTPALSEEVELKTSFKIINLNVGDIVFFSHTCPHRSKKNNTDRDRRILYYTYSLEKNGSKYNDYFRDKQKSKNTLKALTDK
jgi:ectoine hydroxylase-related dioxygenase (phytanoyl-CoA dioxygenase family)